MPFKAGWIFSVHSVHTENTVTDSRERNRQFDSVKLLCGKFFPVFVFQISGSFFSAAVVFHFVDALDVSLRSPPMLLSAIVSAWMTIKPSEPVDRSGPSGCEEV